MRRCLQGGYPPPTARTAHVPQLLAWSHTDSQPSRRNRREADLGNYEQLGQKVAVFLKNSVKEITRGNTEGDTGIERFPDPTRLAGRFERFIHLRTNFQERGDF